MCGDPSLSTQALSPHIGASLVWTLSSPSWALISHTRPPLHMDACLALSHLMVLGLTRREGNEDEEEECCSILYCSKALITFVLVC